jgi:hypothetical protein
VIAEYLRPNVGFGGRLDVGVSELEDNLGIPDRKSILVWDPPAQDEGVIIEAEVVRIDEQDLADPQRLLLKSLLGEFHAVRCCGLPHHFPEVKETRTRDEVVRPQHELAAQVLDLMQRKAVVVGTWLDLRNTPRPTGAHRRLRFWWLPGGFPSGVGNSFHRSSCFILILVLETPEPNLVRTMAWFQSTYTARCNARHRTIRFLFGRR